MAKRQVKLDLASLKTHLDQNLNFVLKNRSVFLAKALSIESGMVKIKNTKGHVLHLPVDQIEEIWAEQKVSIHD